jgi:dihydroorotate dehydrogenase (fumarate)
MDLTTTYLGLELKHPIVAAASPLTASLDGMRRLEDAGAAAVVMTSLYEEQVRSEDNAYAAFTDTGTLTQAEAGNYFPELPDYRGGVSGYLETLRRAAESLEIPVIGSLNGTTPEGWLEFAAAMEQAGAAALELNIYDVPDDPAVSGQAIEARYIEILREIQAGVGIPLSVKLPPYLTSVANMAAQLSEAGAKGLVLFNRYWQPNIDLKTLRVTAELHLSTAAELPHGLIWIGILSRRFPVSLAAVRGVETHEEIIKYLLVGADVVMTASALLRHGPDYMGVLVTGLERWLEDNRFDAVNRIRGLRDGSRGHDASEFLRAQYVRLQNEPSVRRWQT